MKEQGCLDLELGAVRNGFRKRKHLKPKRQEKEKDDIYIQMQKETLLCDDGEMGDQDVGRRPGARSIVALNWNGQ